MDQQSINFLIGDLQNNGRFGCSFRTIIYLKQHSEFLTKTFKFSTNRDFYPQFCREYFTPDGELYIGQLAYLRVAVKYSQLAILEKLVINKYTSYNCVEEAIKWGHMHIIYWVFRQKYVEKFPNFYYNKWLSYAVECNKPEIVRLMLELGATDINPAITEALKRCTIDVLVILLPFNQNYIFNYSMMESVRRGKINFFKYMLHNGFFDFGVALSVAATTLNHNDKTISINTNHSRIGLAKNYTNSLLNYMLSLPQCTQQHIDKAVSGCYRYHTRHYGWPMVAIHSIKTLLAKVSNFNHLLFLECNTIHPDMEIVNRLLTLGANNYTKCLIAAVIKGHIEVVAVLMKYTKDYNVAIKHAKLHNHTKILHMLLYH